MAAKLWIAFGYGKYLAIIIVYIFICNKLIISNKVDVEETVLSTL